MTTENIRGAALFVDAIKEDMSINKTKKAQKKKLLTKLQLAIRGTDEDAVMCCIKEYCGLYKDTQSINKN